MVDNRLSKEPELMSLMHSLIGETLNAFNTLEEDIRRFISEAIGIHDLLLTAPILGQMSTRQLISAFDSLAKHIAQRDDETLNNLSKLTDQLTNREKERNKLVHSRYGILLRNNDYISTYRSMNERPQKGAPISPNSIEFSDKEFKEWLKKIHHTRRALDQFAVSFFTKYKRR